jgi:hypothetical protein
MGNKLDRAKASASTKDCVKVSPAKEPFQVPGPLYLIARQIAFAVMHSGSKLDVEPLLLQSLNPSE